MKIRKYYLIIIFLALISLIPRIMPAQIISQNAKRDTIQTTTQPAGKKVKPTMVLLRSALVPGWGQLYNRQYIKATIFAVGEWYLIYGIAQDWKKTNRHYSAFKKLSDPVMPMGRPDYLPWGYASILESASGSNDKATEFHNYIKYRDRRNLKMWVLAASIFYSMFDAYVDAQLTDFNQTDQSYQAYIGATSDGGVRAGLSFKIK